MLRSLRLFRIPFKSGNLPFSQHIVQRLSLFKEKKAFKSYESGTSYTYTDMDKASAWLSEQIPSNTQRIGYFALSSFHHVAMSLGIWKKGLCAVPLSPLHPLEEIEYMIMDSQLDLICSFQGDPFEKALREKYKDSVKVVTLPSKLEDVLPITSLPKMEDPGLLLYTSGTTSRPKGVVLTHGALNAQMNTLASAWRWSMDDKILNPLPLHHIHGLINVTMCALWSGAELGVVHRFDAKKMWELFQSEKFSLFMAVPTIYAKMIQEFDLMNQDEQNECRKACFNMRLMVSGSMALPDSVKTRWRSISGHSLLERYGMTELGMALSHHIDSNRTTGTVGVPLPGVECKLLEIDSSGIGKLMVKSPMMFKEYYGKPQVTRNSFDADGFFDTGDLARIDENGEYSIIGRSSVDIMKCGGYKVSALEVERVLMDFDGIREVSVFGFPDEEYGECITAVLSGASRIVLEDLQRWCKKHLPPYKIPRRIWQVESIPRNAMGKVNKKELLESYKSSL